MSTRIRFRSKFQGLLVGAVLYPGAGTFATAQEEYFVIDLGQIAGAVIPIMIQEVHLNNITEPGLDPAFQLPAVQVINVADGQGILTPVRLVEGGQAVPIGTLGGAETEAHFVNFAPSTPSANTRLVGTSQTAQGFFHAFIWSEDYSMTDLGTLGGDESAALAINDARQVVGWAQDALGVTHATLWDGVVAPTELDALVGAVGPSCANDIDNYGHIVGQSEYSGFAQATAWVRNIAGAVIPIQLGAMGGDESEALAVEVWKAPAGIDPSLLVAAGWTELTPGGAREAAIWEVDTLTEIINPNCLGTLGGTNSVALDVTNIAEAVIPIQIVGFSNIPVPSPASARRFQRKRASSGDVEPEHAFIWDATNDMRDLNDLIDPNSGWELTQAHSLNTSGSITGYGQFNGFRHAFRLDPINPPQPCLPDSNNTGTVDVEDLILMLAAWGACP